MRRWEIDELIGWSRNDDYGISKYGIDDTLHITLLLCQIMLSDLLSLLTKYLPNISKIIIFESILDSLMLLFEKSRRKIMKCKIEK